MNIKYIIVDDESIAHDIIKQYCSMLPNMLWMKDCYDAIEAMQYLSSNTVDLIFLDLNMPKLRGFDFLKTLPNPPKVIVTTAYKEHALEGYELNVVDYLLKPFSFERFLKAINKASIDNFKAVSASQNKVDDERSARIFLRSNNKYIQVVVDDILYVESLGNYIKIVLKEETISIRGTLSSVMDIIPAERFVQVHRSFMVAQKHIRSIEGNRILMDQQTVPIGKSFKVSVNSLLM